MLGRFWSYLKRYLRSIVLLLLIFCIWTTLLIQQSTTRFSNWYENHVYFAISANLVDKHVTNIKQTCQIPQISPFDKSILEFIAPPQPIQCRSSQQNLLFIDDESRFRFNQTALNNTGYRRDSLKCSYQGIKAKTDDVVVYSPVIEIKEGMFVSEEFILVHCHNFLGFPIYTDFKTNVVVKPPPVPSLSKSQPNIILFMLDSQSRSNFIRQLPATYSFLKNTLGTHIFRGFAKVRDNTYGNMVPVLTGHEAYFNKLVKNGTYDHWPWIWKDFEQNGYSVMFAEDVPEYNMANFGAKGFVKTPPVAHYLRPFWLAAESSFTHKISSYLCLGPTPKHVVQLNYIDSFIRKYSRAGIPFFVVSILTELGHNYLNQIGSADDDFSSFLGRLHSNHLLNNTVMVFMSDHGHRFNSLITTPVGRLENRMPLLSLYLPPNLDRRLIRSNLDRLSSMYDIYYTLLDVLRFSAGYTKERENQQGISLFEEIPLNRTCDDAGITQEFCICESEVPIEAGSDLVRSASRQLVLKLNARTKHMRRYCSEFKLSHIQQGSILVPNSNVSSGAVVGKTVRVIFAVSPGDALFEGTAVKDHRLGDVTAMDIRRINRYGKQADCLKVAGMLNRDNDLRQFCYCY